MVEIQARGRELCPEHCPVQPISSRWLLSDEDEPRVVRLHLVSSWEKIFPVNLAPVGRHSIRLPEHFVADPAAVEGDSSSRGLAQE